jgi:hypothetical protein
MAVTDDYARLKELAEKATPGPWEVRLNEVNSALTLREVWQKIKHGERILAIERWSDMADQADAEFIAAVSPDVVLRLLSEVDGLKERLEHFRKAATIAEQAMRETDEMEREMAAQAAEIERLTEALRRAYPYVKDAWKELPPGPVRGVVEADLEFIAPIVRGAAVGSLDTEGDNG